MPIRVALHVPAPALLIVAVLALFATGTACRQPEAASGAAAGATVPGTGHARRGGPGPRADSRPSSRTSRRATRTSSPCHRRMASSSACSSPRPDASAPSRSAPPAATARSGSAWACARPAARLVTIEYDPARAKEAAANVQRAGLDRHRHGRPRRRLQGDSEAARHLRLRLPRRLEARLQEVLRHGLSAARRRRALPGAQRDQQEERDERFLDAIADAPRPVHVDRVRPAAKACRSPYKTRSA